MKTIISFFSLLLLTVGVAHAKGDSDIVSFSAQSELISSDAGTQTHRVTVSVANNCDMVGVQFIFKLPDGMSLAQEQVSYTESSLYEAANRTFDIGFGRTQSSGGYVWYASFLDRNSYSLVTVSPGAYTIGYFDVIWNTDSENEPIINLSECCISEPVGDFNSYYDDPFSITLETDTTGNVEIGGDDEDPAVAAGLCPDSNHPHIIDMGDAGKWACCNVGASAPWEYGGYYAWGETEEKDYYDWSTYIHCDGSYETCHNLGEDISGTEYDVAHVKWGGNWCIPNNEQLTILHYKCTVEITSVNGINGQQLTAPNGGKIFIPAAGYRYGELIKDVGTDVNFWSSTQNSGFSYYAYFFNFTSEATLSSSCGRLQGHPVRPVISEITENEPYLLLSHKVDDVTYKLYKKNNLTDTHVNADGWTFYKSDLTMEVTKNGDTQSYLVSDDLYLCEGDGQPLCMAFDFNT